jgi:hypothetical protein
MTTVGGLYGIHGEGTDSVGQFYLSGHENSGITGASRIVRDAGLMGKYR